MRTKGVEIQPARVVELPGPAPVMELPGPAPVMELPAPGTVEHAMTLNQEAAVRRCRAHPL